MAAIALQPIMPTHEMTGADEVHRRSSDSEHVDASEPDDHELDGEGVDAFIAAHELTTDKYARTRLFAAFAIFGLLNNVLYVIILSAALDLVPPATPKGIVAFFNIFPALLAKVVWPLVSNGQIRYGRRIGFCTCASWTGIVVIALSSGLHARLFGISLASLSSGLGELTFLQLTTTLPTRDASRTALGAWASGTGFAGIAGAAIWWLLRGLGVKGGLGISSILPLFFPATYIYILPPRGSLAAPTAAYQPLPTSLGDPIDSPTLAISATPIIGPETLNGKASQLRLSTQEKLELLRPLLLRYMLPLCLVYVEEYVINSGVAPTLVFPIPTSGIWSYLFHVPKDYYPFWSLTYQTFVFISRSSLALGFPPIPRRFLPVPTLLQFFVLVLLTLQASRFIFSSPAYTPPAPNPDQGSDRSITFVYLLICLEGLCGGSAYVNTFFHVGREGSQSGAEDGDVSEEDPKAKMEREFRVGATGAADSMGILFASLISMPVEVALCNAQVAKGRSTCRNL